MSVLSKVSSASPQLHYSLLYPLSPPETKMTEEQLCDWSILNSPSLAEFDKRLTMAARMHERKCALLYAAMIKIGRGRKLAYSLPVASLERARLLKQSIHTVTHSYFDACEARDESHLKWAVARKIYVERTST